ncbi:hypothetical protein [Anthocerotibacter panamensis]|uniref:hypothetical protein n=1 Tax=Anthocerotibacter panamensis TaxID=2857077 RepID=UPI001C4018E4|nr:hypothetical protein [Anthocerotibacter panamensis]
MSVDLDDCAYEAALDAYDAEGLEAAYRAALTVYEQAGLSLSLAEERARETRAVIQEDAAYDDVQVSVLNR